MFIKNENSIWCEKGQIMIESIFEKTDFSKNYMEFITIFFNGILWFFLHNMIPLIILHINILQLSKILYIYIYMYRERERERESLQDILYFILAIF